MVSGLRRRPSHEPFGREPGTTQIFLNSNTSPREATPRRRYYSSKEKIWVVPGSLPKELSRDSLVCPLVQMMLARVLCMSLCCCGPFGPFPPSPLMEILEVWVKMGGGIRSGSKRIRRKILSTP